MNRSLLLMSLWGAVAGSGLARAGDCDRRGNCPCAPTCCSSGLLDVVDGVAGHLHANFSRLFHTLHTGSALPRLSGCDAGCDGTWQCGSAACTDGLASANCGCDHDTTGGADLHDLGVSGGQIESGASGQVLNRYSGMQPPNQGQHEPAAKDDDSRGPGLKQLKQVPAPQPVPDAETDPFLEEARLVPGGVPGGSMQQLRRHNKQPSYGDQSSTQARGATSADYWSRRAGPHRHSAGQIATTAAQQPVAELHFRPIYRVRFTDDGEAPAELQAAQPPHSAAHPAGAEPTAAGRPPELPKYHNPLRP